MKKVQSLISIVILMAASSSALAQSGPQSPKQSQHAVRDANRDGLCDECGRAVGSGRTDATGQKAQNGKHYGPGDGTGNQGSRPNDGTGYGAQSGMRSGPQDGTGAKLGQAGKRGNGGYGQSRRGGRR
jgi:hypothetical protein